MGAHVPRASRVLWVLVAATLAYAALAADAAPPASPALALLRVAEASRPPASGGAPRPTATADVPARAAAAPDAPLESAPAAAPTVGIVAVDATPLRAGPHESAAQQALLAPGDVLEIRAARLGYLQVYDHVRERAGFVSAPRVREVRLVPEAAPGLLAVVRFLRDANGVEALGIAYAAAWLRAAPPAEVHGPAGAEALVALGTFADRLAARASAPAPASRAAQNALAAQLEAAAHDGVRFVARERDGRIRLCYDGEAWARVLALPATPAQHAHATLALTRPACADPDLGPSERRRDDETRLALLERIDVAPLETEDRMRVAMRRAALWAGMAHARARTGDADGARAAAQRALDELARVQSSALPDDDQPAYADAAMRVNASRWAAAAPSSSARGLALAVEPGAPGETCVALVEVRRAPGTPLLKRCTYAQVWPASFTVDREGDAAALAVQPTATWRELWVFRRTRAGWMLQVLPPATSGPDVGVAEFAGWVPGGRQALVARESRVEGVYRRRFEVVRLDDLATERQSSEPGALGPFQRWADAGWKRDSPSLR
jgi:hypothetical protein